MMRRYSLRSKALNVGTGGGCFVLFEGGSGLNRLAGTVVLGLLAGLASGPWAEEVIAEIAGTASVIDGDTLEVHGQRIRLHGIDAPESRQMCLAEGAHWRCGQKAALALADKIGTSPVICEEQDVDRYKRIVAVCYVRGEDLNHWMVINGWALAYQRYSKKYVDEERAAQAARVGVWRGKFVPPWNWRRGERLQAATVSDSATGCAIKGNISSSGERIFHIPGGSYYDRTKISPQKGERWFCT